MVLSALLAALVAAAADSGLRSQPRPISPAYGEPAGPSEGMRVRGAPQPSGVVLAAPALAPLRPSRGSGANPSTVRLRGLPGAPARQHSAPPESIAPQPPVAAPRRQSRAATSRRDVRVQIGAFTRRAGAVSAWAGLGSTLPASFRGRPTSVEAVTAGGRTLHRATMSGFSSAAEAAQLCDALIATGRPCIVRLSSTR